MGANEHGEPEREIGNLCAGLDDCARRLDTVRRPESASEGHERRRERRDVAKLTSVRIAAFWNALRARYERAIGGGSLYEALTDGLPHRRGEIVALAGEHRPILDRLLQTGRRIAFSGARRYCPQTLALELRSIGRRIRGVERQEVDLYYELAHGDPFGVVD